MRRRTRPNAGIPELRNACSRKLARVNAIDHESNEVLVTAGAMQGLALAIQAFCDPGDEVLIPDPGCPTTKCPAVSHQYGL